MIVRLNHCVDAFRLHQDTHGHWTVACHGCIRYAVNGEFRNNSELKVSLLVPGDADRVFPTECLMLDSPDIAAHFYDETAAHCRFVTEFPVVDLDVPFDRATIRINESNGSTVTIDVGGLLKDMIPSSGERKRISDLVMRFESVGKQLRVRDPSAPTGHQPHVTSAVWSEP